MKTDLEYLLQVLRVNSFDDLVKTPYEGDINAICWQRKLVGDFSEIVHKIVQRDNITVVDVEELMNLQLTNQGNLARNILLNDLNLLTEYGAAPVLNIITNYDRDNTLPFFATDVYSYHVDRSPVPTNTFLCTYYGDASDILPNNQAIQKILIPEIRTQLFELYGGNEAGFEDFLQDHFFDLHYQALPSAQPINLGLGNLWRLAVDHPNNQVLPCVHRAPVEKSGKRLLLIC